MLCHTPFPDSGATSPSHIWTRSFACHSEDRPFEADLAGAHVADGIFSVSLASLCSAGESMPLIDVQFQRLLLASYLSLLKKLNADVPVLLL